jgi:hypothetical protein
MDPAWAGKPVRVCGFCHRPVTYDTKMDKLPGCYVHASTGHLFCRDENGEEHDCNTKNIPVLQWESPVAEVRRWWRRRKLIRRARIVDEPSPGVRIIREEWDDHGAA